MFGKLLICALPALLYVPTIAVGQDNPLHFRHITKSEGLPFLRTCNTIAQDKLGFMWFGSDLGLHRFDGYEFKNYTHNPADSTSLRGRSVSSFFFDSTNRLWIGSSLGLELYDENKEAFIHIGITDNSGKRNVFTQPILGITTDPKGDIIAYSRAGIFRFDHQKQALVEFKIDIEKPSELRKIEYFNNLLYVGTAKKGLLIFKGGKNISQLNTQNQFLSNSITALYFDNNGLIWVGTDKGLVVFKEGHAQTFKTIVNTYIWNITADKEGNIWVATDGEGIYRFDSKTGQKQQFQQSYQDETSLPSNKVLNVYIDHNQIMWAITQNGNISIARLKNDNKIKRYSSHSWNKNSLSNNIVNSFAEDEKGNIWIATDGGGLNYFNPTTETFIHYQAEKDKPGSLSSNSIISLYIDSDHILWIGTFDGGLCRFNPVKQNFICFRHNPADSGSIGDDHIWAITENSHQNIVIATHSSGVQILDKKTLKFRRIETRNNLLTNKGCTSLFTDIHGDIWIGTFHGLNRWNSVNGDIKHYFPGGIENSKTGSNLINCITKSSEHNLLIGTDNGFLVYDIKANKFKHRSTNDQSLNNSVISLLDDDNGNIWVGSYTGLSKITKATGKIESFDVDGDVSGNLYTRGAILKSKTGKIYFGGIQGFMIIHPDLKKTQTLQAPLQFVNLKIFDQTVKTNKIYYGRKILSTALSNTKEITLTHHENSFSIQFSALDYVNAHKIKYNYRMWGFDQEWRETDSKNRWATYTNLNPGTYTFEVYSTSKLFENPSKTISLKIIISPPWWKTWWAFSLYFLAISGLLMVYFRIQHTRLKYKKELYYEKLQREKELETHQFKVGFFTQVSHEFLTPLTLISGPLQKMLDNKQQNDQTNSYLLLMQRNVNRLLALINQILDLRKIEIKQAELNLTHNDIIGFFRLICENFLLKAEQNNIDFSIETDVDYQLTGYDYDKLEKIITNLLSNAFKYTPPGGKITARISTHKQPDNKHFTEIIITDNGVGIPAQAMDKLFTPFYRAENNQQTGTGIGLALSKELAKLHGGEITVHSTPGKETIFTVTIEVVLMQETLLQEAKIAPTKQAISSTGRYSEVLPETTPLALIVEDNEEMRHFLKMELKESFRLLEAENGNKGLEIAVDTIPDIIISDVMMPEMSGTEMCEKLKSDYRTSHIPVILLTAIHADEKKIESYGLGADEYITKPFNPLILKARVHNLINSRYKLKDLFLGSKTMNNTKPTINRIDNEFIQKMVALIDENLSETNLTPDFVAIKLGLSKTQLSRKMKALSDQTISELIKSVRMHKAAELLLKGELTVSEISYKLGFSEQSNFSRSFYNHFGKYPTQYQKGKNT